MTSPSPSSPEISIGVADFAKKANLEPQARAVVEEAIKAKPDTLLSFKDQAELDAALAEIAKSETDPAKLEALKRLLNAKLQIQLATAAAGTAVVREAAAAQNAVDKKTVETLIRKIDATPTPEDVAACVQLIEADASYTPESKKEIYSSLLRALMFSKGYGYRADLGKVVDPTGKIDEARSQAIAAVGADTIRFTIHYMVSAKAKTGDPRMMANALLREFKIRLPGRDTEVNRQSIHNSNIPEPYKSWLLSWSTDAKSVTVPKAEADLAQRLQDDRAEALRRANEEGVPGFPAKKGNGKMFPRSQAEYDADPSLYMSDAVKALGPTGIMLGLGLLIFSNRIFSSKFTGFDLVAKLGATFLGLKFAGKSGLWSWTKGEVKGETNDTRKIVTEGYKAANEAISWSWEELKKLKNAGVSQMESVVERIRIWYYMSNYSVVESGNRVKFSDAKVGTLDGLDPNSTSSLGIQKSGGKEPIDAGELRDAKSYIEKLKAQRLTDLKASGKSDAQAQEQLKQDIATMSLSHFTAIVNTTIIRKDPVANPVAQPTAAVAPAPPANAPAPAAVAAPAPAPAAAAAPPAPASIDLTKLDITGGGKAQAGNGAPDLTKLK